MKHLIILIAFLFYACSGGGSDPKVNTTGEIIIPETPDPIETTTKIMMLSHNGAVKFFDGTTVSAFKSGTKTICTDDGVCIDNTVYDLDDCGNVTGKQTLSFTPDFINADWAVRNVTPAEAYNAGLMSAYYSEVYSDYVSIGSYSGNKYQTDKTAVVDGYLYLHGTTGGWRDIAGYVTQINHVQNAGFVVYDFDPTARTAKIDGVSVSWATNHFNAAQEWIMSDDVWYSWNGYTWDGATLNESGSPMTIWRSNTSTMTGYTEQAVIAFAGLGANYEIYFIECNSGWLFRYRPDDGTISKIVQIYDGDGQRSNGQIYKSILNPKVIWPHLYFTFGDDGKLYQTDITTGSTYFITDCDDWFFPM